MSSNVSRPDKDTDRTALTTDERDAIEARADDALGGSELIGIDADGRIHYGEFPFVGRVAVFDHAGDTSPTLVDLSVYDVPLEPKVWAEIVHEQYGAWRDLNLSAAVNAALTVGAGR